MERKYKIIEKMGYFAIFVYATVEKYRLFRKNKQITKWFLADYYGEPVLYTGRNKHGIKNYHKQPEFNNLKEAKEHVKLIQKGTIVHELN